MVPPTDEIIRSIATVSLARNASSGVTGYLYFDSGLFLQEIEGLRQDVEALYRVIRGDARHRNVRKLMACDSNSRAFGEWSMAFHDGARDGGSLRRCFGDTSPERLTEEAAPDLLRFLRDLSLRRAGLVTTTTGASQLH